MVPFPDRAPRCDMEKGSHPFWLANELHFHGQASLCNTALSLDLIEYRDLEVKDIYTSNMIRVAKDRPMAKSQIGLKKSIKPTRRLEFVKLLLLSLFSAPKFKNWVHADC